MEVKIVSQVLGNIYKETDGNFCADSIDTIYIEWFNTQKRISRYTSTKGVDVALRFEKPLAIGLSHGDIIFKDKKNIIVVSIVPTHILSIYAKTKLDIARLCYEIGNYHLPLFIGENDFNFCTPYEKPLQRILNKYNIFYKEEEGILDSKDRLQASLVAVEPKLQLGKDFKVIIK